MCLVFYIVARLPYTDPFTYIYNYMMTAMFFSLIISLYFVLIDD